MPELPEVETIARGLAMRVSGDVIESIWLGEKPEPLKSPAPEIAAAPTHRESPKIPPPAKGIQPPPPSSHASRDGEKYPPDTVPMDRPLGNDRKPASLRPTIRNPQTHSRHSEARLRQGAAFRGSPPLRPLER